jgi:cell wall-associated NlpC family hydrolase
VRHIYKSGGRDNLLPMLLLADGAEDLYNRVVLIAKMANQDSRTLEDLYWSKKNLDRLLADLELQKQDGLDLLRQQQQEGMQIQTKLLQYQALRDNIGAQIDRVIAAERERQAKEQEQVLQSLAELRSGAQQYQGPLPQNGNAVVDQLIETAAAYIGIPYVWAGDRPSTGFDCSGFTQYVFGQHGVELPHYSGYQAQMGLTIQPEDIQAGDLLCFGSPVHHVGIYIGEGLFIHAPRTGDVVRIQPLAERTNLTEIRRFELKFRTSAPAVD